MLDEHGNRILWGWIPETRPESEYRAAGWAGAMALPRVLSLAPDKRLANDGVSHARRSLRTSQAWGEGGRPQSSKGDCRNADQRSERGNRGAVRGQRAFHLRLRPEKGEKFAEIAFDPQQKDAELRVNADY